MNLLLDTHAFLWSLSEPELLSRRARRHIEDKTNVLIWSAVSTAEVAIKYAIGKLPLPAAPERYLSEHLERMDVRSMPLRNEHAWRVARLPLHHGDPFDRLLIAQALVEGFPVVTVDPVFRRYGVDVVW